MTRTTIIFCAAFLSAVIFLSISNRKLIWFHIPFFSQNLADQLYDEWNECMSFEMSVLTSSSEEMFWTELEKPIQKCQNIMEDLPIEEFTNMDETKYSILPIDRDTVSNVVTIGVGQDVNAELVLQQRIGNDSVKFFGADPIVEGNDELYSQLGTFFPFAIGNSSRMGTASVLIDGQYVNKRVIHVEFVHFLKEIIGRTFLDNILIDGEYAEYELFDYFYQGGRLDREGITVCQFNMEMHLPNTSQKRKFQEFMTRIYADQKYAFFRPVRGSHIRLYFVNFKDPNCVRKYIVE